MSSKISTTTDDVSSRDFFSSQIERFKAMQLIADSYVCKPFHDPDPDGFDLDWIGAKEFMRLEGIDVGMVVDDDNVAYYPYALLPLVYFNFQHKTDFEFHKFVRGYITGTHPMYIVFEAISPTIAGGLPLVFQAYIGLRPGWPIQEEVLFCRLHPIDCKYTLDDLPVSSSPYTFDHTKACVLAAAAYSTYDMYTLIRHLRERLTLKDIVSFEEIAEPTSLGGFDFKYKITFNVFQTKDAAYVSGPIEIEVIFRQDFKIMELISIVEKEVPNEFQDDLNSEKRNNVILSSSP